MDLFFFEVILWGAFVLGIPLLALLGVLHFIILGRILYHLRKNGLGKNKVDFLVNKDLQKPFSIFNNIDDEDYELSKYLDQILVLRRIIKYILYLFLTIVMISILALKWL